MGTNFLDDSGSNRREMGIKLTYRDCAIAQMAFAPGHGKKIQLNLARRPILAGGMTMQSAGFHLDYLRRTAAALLRFLILLTAATVYCAGRTVRIYCLIPRKNLINGNGRQITTGYEIPECRDKTEIFS